MQLGDGGYQQGCLLAGGDPPEDDMAQCIIAPPTRPACHLAELQGVQEDVVPSKGHCAAGHVDAIRQCACKHAACCQHCFNLAPDWNLPMYHGGPCKFFPPFYT